MQLVDPPHQIARSAADTGRGSIVDGAAADAQQLGLLHDRKIVPRSIIALRSAGRLC